MFRKVNYTDNVTVIGAKNLNDIQDSILALEDGLFSVDNDKSGEVITITDAAKRGFRSFSIFGRTTQDGTPTPENPVDLVSVGDSGSITVNVTGENDAQSMTISTPNGLPGIPVTDGGNYTDSNGQHWICDEIDLAKGVYVQRTGVAVYDGSSDESWVYYAEGANQFNIPVTNFYHARYIPVVYCSHFVADIIGNRSTKYEISYSYTSGVAVNTNLAKSLSEWRTWLAENPITMLYRLATPIETPLTEEELAAYAALHTYKDNTSVSNDASAYMELEYVMDAKKYFDSIGGGASARLGSITLLSSKWVTEEESLHSQVVKISGITAQSKVDLLPSVEQLAIFHNKDVAFVTENEDGVLTVFAIGDKPLLNYTMDVQITEVNA